MKRRLIVLVTVSLLLALFAVVQTAGAAECYRGPGGVYVCDARPTQPTFRTPGYQEGSIFFNRTYAWLNDGAPIYVAPDPAAEIATPGTEGILYYTVEGTTPDGGWYRVGDNEFAPVSTMHVVEESRFSGLEVNEQPQRPFGWVLHKFRPAAAPDMEPPEDAAYIPRYTFIEIYDVAQGADDWVWFDIGGGRWVKQTFLAVIDVSERPEDVPEGAFWVEVDLFEQVMAAYEGDRMVYAGLVSTGLENFETNEGLFQIYARNREWPMWGGEVGVDYYYLQDVPHTMFFDDEIALHGAYWHDDFGQVRSHGCVNMPPRDAEWVWHWSENAPGDVWVYVHSSPQDYFVQRYGEGLSQLPAASDAILAR